MVVLDLSLAYRMTITSVVCPVNRFNVVVTYEQGYSVITVTITRSEYIIEYGDTRKIVIQKNDCDTDRLFQLCMVHPFSMDDLMKMVVDSSRLYKLLGSL